MLGVIITGFYQNSPDLKFYYSKEKTRQLRVVIPHLRYDFGVSHLDISKTSLTTRENVQILTA